MARDVTFTDTLDALLQFLCDAAEAAFVLSWVGLWAYWSWLAGWGAVGIPVALVVFVLALARTIQHATHGEQFHPSVWVVIVSLDVLAGFAIRSTNASLRAEEDRREARTVAAESAVQRLADAAQHDDVAGMTVAVRQVGEAQTKEASETVAQILQKNYGSASSDRRGLALESIEALTRMRAASACALLHEISSKNSDLAETADRAVRNICPSAVAPKRSVVRRESAASQALKLGRSVIAALPNALSPSDLSTASSPGPLSIESDPPALSLAAQCAAAAGQFWHRNGFDKPGGKASNANVDWSYENHYNNELGRCLIAVRLRSTLPNGSIAASTEISDAETGAQPMATLTTRASETAADPQVVALIKNGQRLPPTAENLAWFHGLMTK
jgi:hypothetical protein